MSTGIFCLAHASPHLHSETLLDCKYPPRNMSFTRSQEWSGSCSGLQLFRPCLALPLGVQMFRADRETGSPETHALAFDCDPHDNSNSLGEIAFCVLNVLELFLHTPRRTFEDALG